MKRIGDFWLLPVVGVLLLGGAFWPYRQWYEARRSWVPGRAEIQLHERSRVGGRVRSDLRYAYSYQGVTYHGRDYDLGGGAPPVRGLEAGREVECWINPAEPGSAVLSLQPGWRPLALGGLGVLLLTGGILRLLRRRREEPPGLPSPELPPDFPTVEWTPLSPGTVGTLNFRAVELDSGSLIFRLTPGFWLLPLLLLGGSGSGLVLACRLIVKGQQLPLALPVLVLILALPALFTWLLARRFRMEFDRVSGTFRNSSASASLGEIAGVQLLRKECRARFRAIVTSYELNLVLRDGRRLPVLIQRDERPAVLAALRLTRFLGGLPVLTNFRSPR